jgi:hypothetical protein
VLNEVGETFESTHGYVTSFLGHCYLIVLSSLFRDDCHVGRYNSKGARLNDGQFVPVGSFIDVPSGFSVINCDNDKVLRLPVIIIEDVFSSCMHKVCQILYVDIRVLCSASFRGL